MADIYCPITGWAFMESGDEFIDDISGATYPGYLWGDKAALKGRRAPSRVVREGLRYTDEDIEAMNKYILITPSEMNEEGERVVPELLTEPAVEVVDEKTITYVFGVRPYGGRGSRVFCKGQGDEEMWYEDIGEGRIVVHFCAFLILQHLIPGLKVHTFYNLVMALGGKWSGVLRNVHYGPVGYTQEREVEWSMIADFNRFDVDTEGPESLGGRGWWLELLTQEDQSDEENLQDAWMGCGNMWVFKHPGIFPIAEAVKLAENRPQVVFTTICTDSTDRFKATPLLALPQELMEIVFGYFRSPRNALSLISTTKVLYERYRAHLDKFTFLWIRQQRPWYLPVGPIECEEGDTEIVRWRDDWDKLASEGRLGSEREKPWFSYYLACERSPNMRSRDRIWDNVLQIKRNLAC